MSPEAESPALVEPIRRRSAVLNLLGGSGVGLVAGATGAGVTSGVFVAFYQPHGGGGIGDWTFLGVIIASVVIGLPLGILLGILWRFRVRRPGWQLVAGMAGAGVLAGVVSLLALG